MNPDLVVDINSDKWKKAFEGLKHYFESDQELMKALDIGHQTLYDHRNGERESIDVRTAERILSAYNSEPLIDFDNENLINGTYKRWGERAKINDEVQKYVLGSFSDEELSDIGEIEPRNARKYRNAETNPPLDLWKRCVEEVSEALNSNFYPRGDIADSLKFNHYSSEKSDYNNEEAILIEEADPNQIKEVGRAIRRFESLKSLDKSAYSGLINSQDSIAQIIEVEQDPLKNSVSSRDLSTNSPHFYDAMNKINILKKLGGKHSNYEIIASNDELKAINYAAKKEKRN